MFLKFSRQRKKDGSRNGLNNDEFKPIDSTQSSAASHSKEATFYSVRKPKIRLEDSVRHKFFHFYLFFKKRIIPICRLESGMKAFVHNNKNIIEFIYSLILGDKICKHNFKAII